jgi:hypothetical protein
MNKRGHLRTLREANAKDYAREIIASENLHDMRHPLKQPTSIREAAFASLKAPLRPVRALVDPAGAREGLAVSGRRRTLRYDSHKTIARSARSS